MTSPRDAIPAEGPCDPIVTDLPCITCGYNLRGLHADGTCPECGAAIAAAIAVRVELVGDRRWGRRVVAGAGLLLWLPFVLPAAYGFVTWHAMRMMGHARPAGVVYAVHLLAVVATMGLGMLGTWWITTPSPQPPAQRPAEVWRSTARWAVGTVVAAYLLGAILPRMRHDPAIWQYMGLCLAAVATTSVALGLHTAAVAARLGAVCLAHWLRASLTVLGVLVTFFGLAWVSPGGGPAMIDLGVIYLALLNACAALWVYRGTLRSRLVRRAGSE